MYNNATMRGVGANARRAVQSVPPSLERKTVFTKPNFMARGGPVKYARVSTILDAVKTYPIVLKSKLKRR